MVSMPKTPQDANKSEGVLLGRAQSLKLKGWAAPGPMQETRRDYFTSASHKQIPLCDRCDGWDHRQNICEKPRIQINSGHRERRSLLALTSAIQMA